MAITFKVRVLIADVMGGGETCHQKNLYLLKIAKETVYILASELLKKGYVGWTICHIN